jgi:tetratricopeptide (TPR) repeat protein
MRERGKKEGVRRKKGAIPLLPFSLFLFSLFLTGCHFSTFPDPNDPNRAGALQPEVLRRQVKGASDALFDRVKSGEISDAQYKDLLAKYADDLVKSVHIENVDPARAWEYGEVFRTGRMWKQAEAIYQIAVKAAKDEDRRVNDTLWLAEALANLGRVDEAVVEARKTFDTPPNSKAPILYGVLYNIAPAGGGKGKDAELARLLEDAIRRSDLTRVDESTEAGAAFRQALPHHQRNARRLAAKLYLAAGHEADAERVLGGKAPTIRI